MTQEQIEQYLIENCNQSAPDGAVSGTGLKDIWSRIYSNGKAKNIPKAEAAKALAQWYANKQNIIDVWNGASNEMTGFGGLDTIEKEFISVYVQYGGREFVLSTKAIAEKHKITPLEETRSHSYSRRDFYGTSGYSSKHLRFLHLCKQQFPHTKAVYLFPGGKHIPPFVMSVLKEIIPPMTFEYPAFTPGESDYVICRETRVADVAAVVRFTGSEQVKVKANTYDATKAKLAKMVEAIGFEEICDINGTFATPKEAKHINDFMVALPLFLLVANCGLITVGTDLLMKPDEKAVALLTRPMYEIARRLFTDYLESKMICETHYITYIMLHDGDDSIPWEKVRRPIIDLLKTCPVGQFVQYDDFNKNAAIFHRDFFRRFLNSAVSVRGPGLGYYGSYTPDWEECEAQIIRLILSFCGALGMLDIAYTKKTERFKEAYGDFRVGISGFRMTPLGAWILGVVDTYDVPQSAVQFAEGELIVQPDHTIMISGLKKRVEHEAFLSRFLSKISVDENVSIYRIDFASIVRALDQNATPAQLKAYLRKASGRPLPENVTRSLDDWHAKVGRIKIRSVTLLETDDDLLLQELVHLRGMEKYASDIIKHAVIIGDDAKGKVKALAEKNGWLVEK